MEVQKCNELIDERVVFRFLCENVLSSVAGVYRGMVAEPISDRASRRKLRLHEAVNRSPADHRKTKIGVVTHSLLKLVLLKAGYV